MTRYAVIVAGGKGLRMGADLPKQFILIQGKPLLMHTIKAFFLADPEIRVLLVLPLSHQVYWRSICEAYDFKLPHEVITGGETRFHSVKNGLAHVPSDALVAVHDGVRPFVSRQLILGLYEHARERKGVIPVVEMVDSLREKGADGQTFVVDRAAYVAVQTPQVFHAGVLQQAYDCDFETSFTDDASVYERRFGCIATLAGERENIKITTPFDLQLAEILIKS